jgi:hypothetical protein
VLTWAELEEAAPEIAAYGFDLLTRFQFVLVGTLTKEGAPRVNPCEAYVIDGHLLLNMMPRSLKALDLRRDPRIYVHTPVTSKEGAEGEFQTRWSGTGTRGRAATPQARRPLLADDPMAAGGELSLFRGARRARRVPPLRRRRGRPSLARTPLIGSGDIPNTGARHRL